MHYFFQGFTCSTTTLMARNLELRSTFQFSGDRLGTLTFPKDYHVSRSKRSIYVQKKEPMNKTSFGVATIMSQSIFSSLDEDMKSMSESYSSKKLASCINKAFSADAAKLSLRDAKESLEGFEFNTENPYASGVKFRTCLRNGAHKGQMILHVPAFIPLKELKVPIEATNFKLFARLISVSDIEKNSKYVSLIDSDAHAKEGIYETPMLPVLRIPIQSMTAQLSIPEVKATNNDVSTLLIMGIKFFSYRNSKFSFIPDGGMMTIMNVY